MQARPILLFSLFVVACGGEQIVDEELAEGDEVLEIMEGNLTSCVTVGTNLVTTAAINFRSGPSTSESKLGVLPRNATVTVLRSCPEPGYYSYFNVSYQGKTGWAAGRYLKATAATTPGIPPASGEPTPPPPPAEAPGLLEVPYISQFRPDGADSDYFNGSSNCGPTSMAMIGRFYGYGPGMTDAQLVTHLNLADGKATGATNADGIKKMAATLGKSVGHRLGADLAFVDRSLSEGRPVAARGIFTSVRHYIVVTGKNAQGNYTVNDPASSSRKTLTPAQLSSFINKHPEGAFFSVG